MTLDEWKAQNPMRPWMVKNKKTFSQVSRELGTGQSTVGYWLNGAKVPNDSSFEKIGKLIRPKLGVATLKARWLEWRESHKFVIYT